MKSEAVNLEESMTIEGCYFPTNDEIMRSSGNESEDTFRTFLDEIEKKSTNLSSESKALSSD